MLLWGLPGNGKKQRDILLTGNGFGENFKKNASESEEVLENIYKFAASHWLRLQPGLTLACISKVEA